MQKLAIISTHPIQYYAPLFKMLTERAHIQIKVFYTWPQAIAGRDDPDFGTTIKWDIPLLEGYDYQLVENTSKNPTSKNRKGIDNPTLIKEIETYAPQAIWVFGWNFKSHFAAMRHFKGKIPVWFRGDSTLLDYNIKSIQSLVSNIKQNKQPKCILSYLKTYAKFKIRKAYLSYVYQYVDTAFYVGQNNKAYFMAHGLNEKQLVFAPHAIDNKRFYDNEQGEYEKEAQKWKTSLGIKKDDVVLLYAGKFEPRKNLIFFLHAFNHICKKEDKNLKLILLGNGPLEKEVFTIAKQNQSNIISLPFQNQTMMPIVYRLADFYCLPSQSETWGLAVNEALACGRRVLVSDKVGCAIDLVNDKVGRIFKSGDKADLQEKLTHLMQQKTSTESCQQHIAPWSFEAICESLEKQLSGTIRNSKV